MNIKIIVGQYAGFCGGVQRAVQNANNLLEDNHTDIYFLGELVHNESVINTLKQKGMQTVHSIEDIPSNSTLVIRAHGEPKEIIEKAKTKNLNIIDLTCPKVKNITQMIINNNQDFIILIGKKNHPEITAYQSYAKDCYVIENEEDLKNAYKFFKKTKVKKISIFIQTTFSIPKFEMLLKKIKHIFTNENIKVNNTICNATSLRQTEIKKIAQKVNKLIIIGGKNSSNTIELFNIASKICVNTYHVLDLNELKNIRFDKNDIIGISAGASTPQDIILDIQKYLIEKYN